MIYEIDGFEVKLTPAEVRAMQEAREAAEGYRCRLCAREPVMASDGKTPFCGVCGVWMREEQQ